MGLDELTRRQIMCIVDLDLARLGGIRVYQVAVLARGRQDDSSERDVDVEGVDELDVRHIVYVDLVLDAGDKSMFATGLYLDLFSRTASTLKRKVRSHRAVLVSVVHIVNLRGENSSLSSAPTTATMLEV